MYKKKMISPEGAYKIIEIYQDGRRREVEETQDLYILWKSLGNAAEVEPYVAPPAPPADTRTPAQVRQDKYIRRTNPMLMKMLAYEQEIGILEAASQDATETLTKLDSVRAAWYAERQKIRQGE